MCDMTKYVSKIVSKLVSKLKFDYLKQLFYRIMVKLTVEMVKIRIWQIEH